MVTIWTALYGILEDAGFSRCEPSFNKHRVGSNQYYTFANGETKFLAIWTIDRHYKIYVYNDAEISIVRKEGGGESVAVDIDLREEQSVDQIRKVILDRI